MRRPLTAPPPDRHHLSRAILSHSGAPSGVIAAAGAPSYDYQSLAMRLSGSSCSLSQIKRKHEIEYAVRVANAAGQFDREFSPVGFACGDVKFQDVNSCFELANRLPHTTFKQTKRGAVHWREHQIVDPAAEVRTHHSLTGRGRQNDSD